MKWRKGIFALKTVSIGNAAFLPITGNKMSITRPTVPSLGFEAIPHHPSALYADRIGKMLIDREGQDAFADKPDPGDNAPPPSKGHSLTRVVNAVKVTSKANNKNAISARLPMLGEHCTQRHGDVLRPLAFS